MSLTNNPYYDNLGNDQAFMNSIKDHSMYMVWRELSEYLKTNHQHDSIMHVECGRGYLLYYLMHYCLFTNVHGIDMRSDLVTEFKIKNQAYKSSIDNKNFFRLSDRDLKQYDVFIFSKLLEYCENDFVYLKPIPRGKLIVAMYPNLDDGLCLRHFEGLSSLEKHLEPIMDIQLAKQIEIFKNSEYMINSRVNIAIGYRR